MTFGSLPAKARAAAAMMESMWLGYRGTLIATRDSSPPFS
jgi:hypothetical protein